MVSLFYVVLISIAFILHIMIEMLSSHLTQSEIIIYGLVRKCVKLSPFSKTIFILDLALDNLDKL